MNQTQSVLDVKKIKSFDFDDFPVRPGVVLIRDGEIRTSKGIFRDPR